MKTTTVSTDRFLALAHGLNLNSVVGDELDLDTNAQRCIVTLRKNTDAQLAALSKLPAAVVQGPEFATYSEAHAWCLANIPACAVNADFCRTE